jgi:hypothetical protein
MRRFVPYVLLVVLVLLAGLATAVSWTQSRERHHDVGIVSTCARHVTQEPRRLVVSCADANSVLASLRWTDWGDTTAYATGVARWNDCTPTCVAGHWKSEPIVAWAWRLRGHLYTRLASSDPRFFGPGFVVQGYPPSS